MSRSLELLALAVALVTTGPAAAQAVASPKAITGMGRAATADELEAWDIDVRPDFTGLPKGSGSVTKGQDVWEGKCASCHGTFGESNEVFAPIVGGTTADDIKAGRVKGLSQGGARTTLAKLPTLSTLWDYINRAMPWTAPKTLSTEEVYAVTAYILNLGEIVPADFVLSDQNIRDVQKRLPNRDGMTTDHGLWTPGGKPDVKSVACMSNCEINVAKVASYLPNTARNAHGNLAEQTRPVGAVRGVDTSKPPATPAAADVATLRADVAVAAAPAAATAEPARPDVGGAAGLAKSRNCLACHGLANKIVGPGFNEIAAKYKGRVDAASYLAGKIKAGGSGVWGAVPMPAQPLSDAEAGVLGAWLAGGAQ